VYRYRQLLPSAASLHSNRTVVVAVCYDHTYWAVINSSWNTFLLEDIGYDLTQFRSAYYKANTTVEDIRQILLQHIGSALTDPSGVHCRICEDAAGPNSTLSQYKDKSQESVYIRSQQLSRQPSCAASLPGNFHSSSCTRVHGLRQQADVSAAV